MIVQLGKKGITRSSLEEIAYQLKEKKEIKVKMLRSLSEGMKREEVRDAFNSIIHHLEVIGISIDNSVMRGNTITITRKAKAEK